MSAVQTPIYQEIYYFLASSPSTEQILAFRPSEDAQARLGELLQASKEGRLSTDEQRELDEFEQVEHFVRMLKLHTRKMLNDK